MSGKMSRGKCLTTAEIIEECERLSEDDIPDSIYILPPIQTCDETDEDSGDEDDFDPNRLNRNQLTAPAEVRFSDREDRSDDIPHDESASAFKKLKVCEWVHGDISDVESIPVPEEKCFLPPLTISEHSEAIDFLKLFLNEEIVEGLVKHTSMYSSQKNSSLLVNHDDISKVISQLSERGLGATACCRGEKEEEEKDFRSSIKRHKMEWTQVEWAHLRVPSPIITSSLSTIQEEDEEDSWSIWSDGDDDTSGWSWLRALGGTLEEDHYAIPTWLFR
ncbi:uncharacterized protein LOC124161457 [Ischnura elegans]|uniref:uncharacterized protein LOC124161457 n=1 Tax=Ischnura elegans TaxID=197161 RepID=UPI001ED8AED3|nr:uncharacterized protein LOC124161457 [Ischnura elegans]